jgi:hypothetical protein
MYEDADQPHTPHSLQERVEPIQDEWQDEISRLLLTTEFRSLTSRSNQMRFFRERLQPFPYATIAALFQLTYSALCQTIRSPCDAQSLDELNTKFMRFSAAHILY